MKLQGICGLSDGEAGLGFCLLGEILRAFIFAHKSLRISEIRKIAFMRPIS